ncbi:internalin N-terminal domain-containing protein [Listeria seeligeri]|uniref:internalin N-terminal domain-containing protein n=1 Tax=Listeria seeligeri TaxID=1640 RepID=UPI0011D09A71|nr:internalin N-terminal domain-containing protein [Listeria seeligeri]MBC1724500.1 hypothetical protein [Listeria seeligeri]MBF2437208.1 internalin N-terminal domain-containing protein [Listeria seeligeri]MBF2599830.1 internalin N-terminal domain-containing protein [Listeria seeligeri]
MRENVLIGMLITFIVMCVSASQETNTQAVSIPHPMTIDQIFPDSGLEKAVKQSLGKKSVKNIVSQKELGKVQEFYDNNYNVSLI